MQPREASVFSFMYQLMLALGAIECTFTLCESFASALDCKIPYLKKRPCFLRGLVAIVLFFLTIPCCFQVFKIVKKTFLIDLILERSACLQPSGSLQYALEH